MICRCVEITDAKLSEFNTRLKIPIMIGSDQTKRVMIETEQIDKGRGKKKAVGMFGAFCPFCGVKL